MESEAFLGVATDDDLGGHEHPLSRPATATLMADAAVDCADMG